MATRRLPRLSELPNEVSTDEFWALFGDMEYERLDFKESASYLKDIIPAMAMTLGGIVICGISDTRQVIGCPWGQKTLDKVARAGHETGVDVQARALVVDGQELTIVAIP